jgi:hypothetical protein
MKLIVYVILFSLSVAIIATIVVLTMGIGGIALLTKGGAEGEDDEAEDDEIVVQAVEGDTEYAEYTDGEAEEEPEVVVAPVLLPSVPEVVVAPVLLPSVPEVVVAPVALTPPAPPVKTEQEKCIESASYWYAAGNPPYCDDSKKVDGSLKNPPAPAPAPVDCKTASGVLVGGNPAKCLQQWWAEAGCNNSGWMEKEAGGWFKGISVEEAKKNINYRATTDYLPDKMSCYNMYSLAENVDAAGNDISCTANKELGLCKAECDGNANCLAYNDVKSGASWVGCCTKTSAANAVSVSGINFYSKFVNYSLNLSHFPMTHKVVGYYPVHSFNQKTGVWHDLSIARNNATTVGAKTDGKFVYGGVDSTITFPEAILPAEYTFIYIAKYNGSSKNRIFSGTNSNWLSGFWAQNVGVAYHNDANGFLTKIASMDHSKPILGVDTNSAYRVNGRLISDPNYVLKATSHARLGVNIESAVPKEKSEWAIQFMMVYNTVLQESTIKEIESYLINLVEPDDPSKYIMFGPWIANNISSIPVQRIARNNTRIIYIAQDGDTTKMVDNYGVARYYIGAPSLFDASKWESYSDAQGNYKVGAKPDPAIITGRFVRITRPGPGVINLAGMRVYEKQGGEDIAKGKPVTGSSLYDANAFPNSNLTDNNNATFAHTADSTGEHWFEIDLGKDSTLYSINITNRQDCCQDRIIGSSIIVYDTSRKQVWKSDSITQTKGEYVTLPSTINKSIV